MAVDEPQAFSEWMQWCLEKPVFQLDPCSVLVFIIAKITIIKSHSHNTIIHQLLIISHVCSCLYNCVEVFNCYAYT